MFRAKLILMLAEGVPFAAIKERLQTTAPTISRGKQLFMEDGRRNARRKQEIHIVLDNLSAHKTQAVRDFLETHPQVRLHFTPTYSSWLNQVELWFVKIERNVIARRVHFSA